MISAIVLTKNEEKNIKKCLESIRQLADEIIVIDDNSDDKTRKIAKNFGAKVFKRKLKDNFSNQRNFGLKKARGEWVLFIDADERLSKKLRDEITKNLPKLTDDRQQMTVNSRDNIGYKIRRKDKFLGKWLNFGETAHTKFLRLAKKGSGEWKNPVHEVWQVKGKIGKLKNPIIHDRKMNVGQFLEKINQYSSLRAKELYKEKVKTNAFLIMLYPMGKFVQNYFLRLGFLDTRPGLVMAIMMSIHSFLVRAKLYLLWKNRGEEEFKIPPLKELYKKYG